MRIVLNNSKLVFAEFKFVPDHENSVLHPSEDSNSSLVLTGLNLIAGHVYRVIFKSDANFTMLTGDGVRFTKDSLSAYSCSTPSIKNIMPEGTEVVANQEYKIDFTAKSGIDLDNIRLGLYSKGAIGCTIYMAIKDITE